MTRTRERPDPPSAKLSVLFISRKWPPAVGGMETYSAELCAELGEMVQLATRVLPGRDNGYPPTAFELLRFFAKTAVFLLTRSRGFDIIHFGDVVLFPLAWLHARRHPRKARFLTVHGLDLLYGNRHGLAPRIYRHFLGWARRNASAVHCYIANSRNTARLADEAGLQPSIAIPLGVRISNNLLPRREPAQPPYLLFVGRLVPRKGAAWFANNVLPKLPHEMELHVVGKPWDATETADLEGNPRVKLLGYLNNEGVDRERANCLAIVMPNRTSPDNTDVEGFGIAALEAARDGVPILASAVEGIIDAIVDGKSGYLIAEGDTDAWVEAIGKIENWSPSERSSHADLAQAEVREHFTWHRVAADTLAAYRAYAS